MYEHPYFTYQATAVETERLAQAAERRRIIAENPSRVVARDGQGRVIVRSQGQLSRYVRDNVFRRFITTREDKGGTGLGLAIVRAVAEAHGGRALLCEQGPPEVVFSLSIPALRGVRPVPRLGPSSRVAMTVALTRPVRLWRRMVFPRTRRASSSRFGCKLHQALPRARREASRFVA